MRVIVSEFRWLSSAFGGGAFAPLPLVPVLAVRLVVVGFAVGDHSFIGQILVAHVVNDAVRIETAPVILVRAATVSRAAVSRSCFVFVVRHAKDYQNT